MRCAPFALATFGQPPRLLCVWISVCLLTANTALAADYYVATTGNDADPGSLEQPFATLQKGANVAVAGDTVYIRGGTYKITTPAASGAGIQFTKSGTSDTKRIRYWAYNGEIPVFDFSNLVISTSGYTHGFVVSASWLHFKGLEICNVPMNSYSNNGVAVDGGSNDIFELLNMHHNSGNGIFIGKGSGGHLVLNCDAHDNYDATSNQGEGQNADGFGVHYQTAGASTIIRGCRAWWNSDDGYDLINQEVPVIVENSWAMGNGYANYGTYSPTSGNGNGFKMGSSKTGVRHLVQNNVAWKNKASGFYANHSSGGNTWYNNTSYSNGTQYNMLASPSGDPNTTITLTGDLVHIMRNNIGFPNKNSNMTGVDTAFNSWDLNLTPAAKDFLSIADPSVSGTGASVETSGALGPRQTDGSMPNVDFLKLASTSQMIDKGTDVGLLFVGAAPDLGAYEFGAASAGTGSINTGTGGAASVGSASVGGAANSATGTKTGGAGGRAGAGGATNSATNTKTGSAGGRAATDTSLASGGIGTTVGENRTTSGYGSNGIGGGLASAGGLPAQGGTSSGNPATGNSSAATNGGTGGVAVGGAGVASTTTAGSSSIDRATVTVGGQGANGSETTPTQSGCSCVTSHHSGRGSPGAVFTIVGMLGLVLKRRATLRHPLGTAPSK